MVRASRSDLHVQQTVVVESRCDKVGLYHFKFQIKRVSFLKGPPSKKQSCSYETSTSGVKPSKRLVVLAFLLWGSVCLS